MGFLEVASHLETNWFVMGTTPQPCLDTPQLEIAPWTKLTAFLKRLLAQDARA